MFVWDLVVAFIVALILSILLGAAFRWERRDRPGVASAVAFLFIILFLATWAGGVWVTPFGPSAWGVFWLPFVVVGVIFAFLIMALVPGGRPRTRREAREQVEQQREADSMLGGLFWFFIVLLIIAVIAGYIW